MPHRAYPIGIAAALLLSLSLPAQAGTNEEATQRHLAALLADPAHPRLAELAMFFTLMPKGGDLHHHYSGSVYAEQYLEWVDNEHYCVDRATFRIESRAEAVAAARQQPADRRSCVSGQDVMNDSTLLAKLLQRWSDKDFYNHTTEQMPPDRQFFDTFLYFDPVASSNAASGLQRLKQRAVAENVGYIETIYALAPGVQDTAFDQAALGKGMSDADFTAFHARLDKDAAFQRQIAAYAANLQEASTGIDDAGFMMLYQPYALRFLAPSQVFSQLVAGFQLARRSPQIVGVNIVGQESVNVSMRDYALHMKMFRFLKARYPGVRLSIHAGELALGTVPPEGLTFHIREAVDVAGANRIGHALDLVHEQDPFGLMKTMRDRHIAVEINLTSNDFILGVKGQAHPVTLYRKYGVPYVIATDDAGVSRNNLSAEYALYATRYAPTYAEVKQLSYDSLRYGFMTDADKQRLLQTLTRRFTAFEAAIAASEPDAVR